MVGGVRSERGNAENSGLKAVVEGRVLGTNNREGNSEGRVWTTIRSQQHTRCAGRQASGGVIDNNESQLNERRSEGGSRTEPPGVRSVRSGVEVIAGTKRRTVSNMLFRNGC